MHLISQSIGNKSGKILFQPEARDSNTRLSTQASAQFSAKNLLMVNFNIKVQSYPETKTDIHRKLMPLF